MTFGSFYGIIIVVFKGKGGVAMEVTDASSKTYGETITMDKLPTYYILSKRDEGWTDQEILGRSGKVKLISANPYVLQYKDKEYKYEDLTELCDIFNTRKHFFLIATYFGLSPEQALVLPKSVYMRGKDGNLYNTGKAFAETYGQSWNNVVSRLSNYHFCVEAALGISDKVTKLDYPQVQRSEVGGSSSKGGMEISVSAPNIIKEKPKHELYPQEISSLVGNNKNFDVDAYIDEGGILRILYKGKPLELEAVCRIKCVDLIVVLVGLQANLTIQEAMTLPKETIFRKATGLDVSSVTALCKANSISKDYFIKYIKQWRPLSKILSGENFDGCIPKNDKGEFIGLNGEVIKSEKEMYERYSSPTHIMVRMSNGLTYEEALTLPSTINVERYCLSRPLVPINVPKKEKKVESKPTEFYGSKKAKVFKVNGSIERVSADLGAETNEGVGIKDLTSGGNVTVVLDKLEGKEGKKTMNNVAEKLKNSGILESSKSDILDGLVEALYQKKEDSSLNFSTKEEGYALLEKELIKIDKIRQRIAELS